MYIDPKRIQRLISLSKNQTYDPYKRFTWPDDVYLDRMWCDEDLLTTYGTKLHDKLLPNQKIALSKWEAINFFSLNVHGIKGVLEFICRCIYEQRYDQISEYLHIFVSEENAHMWFFATFCKRYANKIYSSPVFHVGDVGTRLENDLYMFASTLVFEEFVDFYNHKVGSNPAVADIVRDINYQHHLDESRHVSFGREMVKELYAELLKDHPDEGLQERVSETVKNIIRYFVSLMYNPQAYADAEIVETCGFSSAAALRNALRRDPDRREHHGIWFRRTADYFMRAGIIDETGFVLQ